MVVHAISVHQANATGRYGARLSVCEAAYRSIVPKNILELDPSEYLGGVALWGAVGPVYDTTGLPPEAGVHVHARKGEDSDKEIDATYDAVVVRYQRDLLRDDGALITSDAAISYYISLFLRSRNKLSFLSIFLRSRNQLSFLSILR